MLVLFWVSGTLSSWFDPLDSALSSLLVEDGVADSGFGRAVLGGSLIRRIEITPIIMPTPPAILKEFLQP